MKDSNAVKKVSYIRSHATNLRVILTAVRAVRAAVFLGLLLPSLLIFDIPINARNPANRELFFVLALIDSSCLRIIDSSTRLGAFPFSLSFYAVALIHSRKRLIVLSPWSGFVTLMKSMSLTSREHGEVS